MKPKPPEPIVVLAGFLISPAACAPMQVRLEQLGGQPLRLAAVGQPEWLLTVGDFGQARILGTGRQLRGHAGTAALS